MKTYLIIKENEVINTAFWDGESDCAAPDGTTAILAPEGVWIGWKLVDDNWVAPQPPAPEPEDPAKTSARAKLAALGLTEDEITAMVGA
jgi:hypothetical protein